MADACDAVVIVGSDYTDVASPAELAVNARIAVNLGAPVLLAVAGQGPHRRGGRARRRRHVWPSWPPSMPTPPRWWPTAATPSQLSAVAEALRAFAPQSYVLPE